MTPIHARASRPFLPQRRTLWRHVATALLLAAGYVSGHAGITDLYVMDAANGRSHSITRDRANAGSPVWSPDGTETACSSARGGVSQMSPMKADG